MPSWDHSDTYSSATTCSSTWTAGCSVVVKGCILQGGRWYFPPREITALVGGPGNMAVYHHILVIPPTAVLHYRRQNAAMFWFYHFCQKKTPNLDTAKTYRQLSIPPKDYRQLSIPPKRYRQHWIPPKRYRRHFIPPKRYRRYWIPPETYRLHWIPPKTYRLFVLCLLFVLCFFWFFWFLFGRTSLWTCGQRDAPAPAHTPAPTPAHTTLSVVQQKNERFRVESQCY